MACRAVFCWASANLSSLHVLHSLLAHCSAAMLASSLFLKLRRPLLPQILQTCCLLCCKASCAHSMQPIPVHPFGSSLDRHFLREVSVGSAPPSPELTSSASMCSQASPAFPSEHAPQFLSVGGCAFAVLFPTWCVSSLVGRTGSPLSSAIDCFLCGQKFMLDVVSFVCCCFCCLCLQCPIQEVIVRSNVSKLSPDVFF